MAELVTGTDSRAWIGPAVTRDSHDTLAAFQAVTGWVEVGLIESIGRMGDSSNEVTGNVISEGRTRKAKGVRNAGSFELVVFTDPEDDGQAALIAAELTNNKFALKVSPADRPVPTGKDSIRFMRVLVMSAQDSELTSDGLLRTTFNCGIDSAIFRVAASAT